MSENNTVINGQARFLNRHDTAQNWMTINPVLGEGELGVVIGDERVGDLIPKNWPESDRVKIGDGVHNWNDLPWFRGPIGPQGEKGDNGEPSNLSESAPAIVKTVSEPSKSLTLNDVSPLAHKCSCKLLNGVVKFDENNMLIQNTNEGYTIDNNKGTLTLLVGSADWRHIIFEINPIPNQTYTFLLSFYGDGSEKISNAILTSDYGREEFFDKKSGIVFTAGENDKIIRIEYTAEPYYAFKNLVLKPCLLLGEVTSTQAITDFSTVTVIVGDKPYTPTENGIVTGIDSVSPTMVITTDNEHANIVDFTYCVDTKKYVDSNATTADFITIVDALPEVGESNKIYLVPKAESQTQNLFDEYLWANGAWEWITTKQVEVNLDEYLKKNSEANTVERLYGIDRNGNQIVFGIANTFGANAIPKCNSRGSISSAEPQSPYNVATKQYVDNAIASLKAELTAE